MATKSNNNSLGVTDLPLDTTDGDWLGITPYADGLYRFIANCETPMTIGVQGEWGSGKSSLMKLVCKKIENDDKILVHWFDTWQYGAVGNESTLGLQLLSDLTESVAEKHSQDMNIMMKSARLMNFAQRAMHAAQSGAKLVGKAALAGAANMATGGVIDGGTLVGGFFPSESTEKQIKLSDVRNGFLSVVDAHVNSMKVEGSRVVVFIDDLDRIHPGKAVLFLEMLKNFVEVKNCVFVIACDFEVIREGVRDRLGIEDPVKVQAFFDKIFQVPFVLPTDRYKSDKILHEFIFKALGTHANKLSQSDRNTIAGQVSNSIIECVDISTGTNPRALKRYFNLIDLLVCVQKSQNKTDNHSWSNATYLAVLLSTIAFHKRWPVIVSYISNISSPGDFNRTIQSILDSDGSDQVDEQVDDVIRSCIQDLNGSDQAWQDSSDGDALIQFVKAYVQVLDQDSNGIINQSEFDLMKIALSILQMDSSKSNQNRYESSIYKFVEQIRKSSVPSASQEADFILYVMNSIVHRLKRNKYCKLTRSEDRFNPQIQVTGRGSFAPITFSVSPDASRQAVQIQMQLGPNQAKRQEAPELISIGDDFLEKTKQLGIVWEPTGQKYRARFNLGPKGSLQAIQAKFVDHVIHLIDQCIKAVSQLSHDMAEQPLGQNHQKELLT
jgi:hypothetical protein